MWLIIMHIIHRKNQYQFFSPYYFLIYGIWKFNNNIGNALLVIKQKLNILQVLEEQRMDFQKFIRKRQDALDTQCSAITDWAMLMSSELRRRDQDLHRFLSEDLQYTTGNNF